LANELLQSHSHPNHDRHWTSFFSVMREVMLLGFLPVTLDKFLTVVC